LSSLQIFRFPLFILWGHTTYKIKGEDVRNILNIIQPGDIILRRYDHYLTGLLIPGYFTHAAIVMGNNKIIHMLGSGINRQDILTFTRCDDIAIIRCNNEQIKKIAIKKAKKLYEQDVEYDFEFNFSNNTRFSCTELIEYVYNKPKMQRKKKDYIMPDDLLNLDKTLFQIVYKGNK